jgi:hypothetical protein
VADGLIAHADPEKSNEVGLFRNQSLPYSTLEALHAIVHTAPDDDLDHHLGSLALSFGPHLPQLLFLLDEVPVDGCLHAY